MSLAARAGLTCDPWQTFIADKAMGIRADGRWAARNVGIVVPRQNGKGGLLEVRQLAGLFLFKERLLIHSAHEQRTSSEHFLRLLSLIESVPEFEQRVDKAPKGKGSEAIILKSGARILFVTRTGGGGRGLTVDFIAYDEAMILPEAAVSALNPTQSAVWNPQTWYTGSAVDREKHEHGVVLARQRERGLRGSKGIAYFEFSAQGESPDDLSDVEMADPGNWALANPGLGIRIDAEHVENERDGGLSPRDFAVERLGVGDWPAPDGSAGPISPENWLRLLDRDSLAADSLVFVLDVTPERSFSAIGVAGRRADGLGHVEVVEHRRGTGWVVDRMVELVKTHEPLNVFYDEKGPVSSLIPELLAAGVVARPVNAAGMAQACGMFVDAVNDGSIRHIGQPELLAAIRGVAKRSTLGDAMAWSRKHSSDDISPLVACTLAHWGRETAVQSSWHPL